MSSRPRGSKTKKQRKLERERKKEEKRQAEEKRKLEIEIEKRKNEHIKKLKIQRENEFLAKERVRLEKEQPEELKEFLRFEAVIGQARQDIKKQREWEKYMECEDEYDVESAKDVNQAISILGRSDEMSWASKRRT